MQTIMHAKDRKLETMHTLQIEHVRGRNALNNPRETNIAKSGGGNCELSDFRLAVSFY